MIVVLIALVILIAIASVITQKFKFKQESSVLIAFLSIAMFLYITGLVNLMKYAVYIIYFIALASIIYTIYAIVKKKIKIKEIFTPNIIIYGVVVFLVAIIVKDTTYHEWDEFSHWGSNLKAMVQYDLFWSNNIYDGVHVVYTPLAGLVEYFFCKINMGFAEDISYMAINMFIITLLLPILKNLKHNFKDILKAVLFWISVYIAVALFNFWIASIYIDLLLGMLFAVGMFLAYRLEGKEDKINLVLILISMPILKDTGLLLLGIILMQLFFNKVILKIIKDKKITKKTLKKLGVIILLLIVPLTFYASWKVYCKANDRVLDDRHDKNAISQIDIKQYVKALILKQTDKDAKYKDISTTFYNALNSMVVAGEDGNQIGTVVKIAIILDIIGIIFYIITKEEKEKKKIITMWLSYNIGLILYCLLLLATFMFAFTEVEGRSLASYSRYMSTYFIAWTISVIAYGVQKEDKKGLIAVIIAILLCIYPINITKLVDIEGRKQMIGMPDGIQEKADIIKEKVNLGEKVYLIYQNIPGGFEYHILRYSISPIVTNLMYEWSLGPAYNADDIWSYNLSKEELEQKLIDENFNYVFVAKADKQLVEIYGELFEPKVSVDNYEELTNNIYKVTKTDDTHITLVKY